MKAKARKQIKRPGLKKRPVAKLGAKFLPAVEMFPVRLGNANLYHENSLEGYAPWTETIIERGTYFNKVAYKAKPGWKILGWAAAPYAGGSPHALVFEKVTPAVKDSLNYHERKEPGVYWMHQGNTVKILCSEI